jgi:hypothetical protein
MTIPRYLTLTDYWSRHPPIHLMMAAYLGVGKEKAKKKLTEGELQEFIALSQGANARTV